MSNSAIENPNNIDLNDNTYYSVQYGLVILMAFYNQGIWYMAGQPEIKESDLRFDLRILQKICTQDELVKGVSVSPL